MPRGDLLPSHSVQSLLGLKLFPPDTWLDRHLWLFIKNHWLLHISEPLCIIPEWQLYVDAFWLNKECLACLHLLKYATAKLALFTHTEYLEVADIALRHYNAGVIHDIYTVYSVFHVNLYILLFYLIMAYWLKNAGSISLFKVMVLDG